MQRIITLTWHGHACFSINNETWTLVLDPYNQTVGYPPLKVKAHAMLASHQHGDHNYRKAVEFLPAPTDLVRPVDLHGKLPHAADPDLFYCKKVETCHDEASGSKRGKNTVHIIYTQGFSIAHLGDLGHILTPEQIDQIGRPDLLLIPVGGYFTIDAAAARQVIRQIQPVNIAPMHYLVSYVNLPISGVEPFIRLIAEEWTVRQMGKPSLELNSDMNGNCFVFRYQAGA